MVTQDINNKTITEQELDDFYSNNDRIGWFNVFAKSKHNIKREINCISIVVVFCIIYPVL